MRKKSIASFLLIALLLCVSMALPCTAASAAPTITVTTVGAKPGDTVSLDIVLSGNPGICTMRLYLHYTKGLTLVDAKDTDLLHDSVFGKDFSENPYILSWDDSLAKTDNTVNGVIAKLTFQVADTAAAGSYRVWVTYDNGDIYNLELTDRNFTLVEGAISVSASGTQPTAPASSESGSEPTSTATETTAKPNHNDPNSPHTGSPVAPTSENPIVPSSAENQAAPDSSLLIILGAVLFAALLGSLIVILILRKKRKE